MKAAGHAVQPKINKQPRRRALGGGVDLQGGGDGGMYIAAAAGPKNCTRSAMKAGQGVETGSSLDFRNLLADEDI